jgi:hypothetical protein
MQRPLQQLSQQALRYQTVTLNFQYFQGYLFRRTGRNYRQIKLGVRSLAKQAREPFQERLIGFLLIYLIMLSLLLPFLKLSYEKIINDRIIM